MALAACALVIGLGGCLYLDGINHPPVAAIDIAVLPPDLDKSAAVTFSASGSTDPDQTGTRGFKYTWFIGDQDLSQGKPSYVDQFSFGPDGATMTASFSSAGTYTIAVEVRDSQGAVSANRPSVKVTVVDDPPKIDELDVEPTQTWCPGFPDESPQGAPTLLVGKADDMAENAFDAVTYAWSVEGLDVSHAMDVSLGDGSCATPDATRGVLQFPSDGVGNQQATTACFRGYAPATYHVQLFADDGAMRMPPAPSQSRTVDITVGPDRPPCITDVWPPLGSYPFDATVSEHPFAVTTVADDLDPYPATRGQGPRFTWQVWREDDPVWRTVPDWNLNSYVAEASSFDPGERVRLRVSVTDRTGVAPACTDASAGECPLDPSQRCFPSASMCDSWVTWDLSFR